MTDAGFFRVSCLIWFIPNNAQPFPQGTNSEQDSRFYNKNKKLMKTMKFPPNISTKVLMVAVSMAML